MTVSATKSRKDLANSIISSLMEEHNIKINNSSFDCKGCLLYGFLKCIHIDLARGAGGRNDYPICMAIADKPTFIIVSSGDADNDRTFIEKLKEVNGQVLSLEVVHD